MSDLCYNCGDCHLPKPCRYSLKLCDLCNNYGHTYNFCPTSVLTRDPAYQYWALCHNCDKWHLPQPCALPLHKCIRCHHSGHMEPFCPVNAVDRKAAVAAQDTKTGVKRQRTNGSDYENNVVPEFVHPEVVRRIKLDATYEVLNIMSKGFGGGQVIQYMSRPATQLNTPAPSQGTVGGANVKTEDGVDNTNGHAIFSNQPSILNVNSPQATAKQHVLAPMMQPTTPTPAPRGSFNEGVYASMHERFIRGDLIQSQGQGVVNPHAATASQVLGNMTLPNIVPQAQASSQGVENNNNTSLEFTQPPATQGVENNNNTTTNLGFTQPPTTQGWIPQDAVNGNTAPAAATQGSMTNEFGTPYDRMDDFGKGNISNALANVAEYNMRDQAQANLSSNTGFPSIMNGDNNIQPNPLLQTQVAVQHAQPEPDPNAETEGYVMVQDSTENPEPELKKNGQPKKKATRKRKV